jgi:hypothetical protein
LPSKGNKEKEKKKNKEKKKKSKTTPIHEVGEPDGEQEETTLHDKEDVASAHGEKQLEMEVLYFSISHPVENKFSITYFSLDRTRP